MRSFAVVSCLGLFLGCAQSQSAGRPDSPPTQAAEDEPAAVTSGSGPAIHVMIEPKLAPAAKAVWLTYALSLANERTQRTKAGREPDPLAEHAAALRTVTVVSAELGDKATPDPLIEQLAKVIAADFVEEYALYFAAEPGWLISGEKLAALKLPAFVTWLQQNLPGHVFTPQAAVRFAEAPPVPGSELEAHMPQFSPPHCGDALSRMKPLIAQWEQRPAVGGEHRLSTDKREQFFRALLWLQSERAAATGDTTPRSVRWISPQVFGLYVAAAFCAIEAQEAPVAERFLRAALQLNPAHVLGYAELAHVLILQGRFDEALAQIDVAFRRTTDPCVLAILLRKRGYIHIEQRKYPEAKAAYRMSLTLAPGNALALKELRLIDEALRESGAAGESAVPIEQESKISGLPQGTILTRCQQ